MEGSAIPATQHPPGGNAFRKYFLNWRVREKESEQRKISKGTPSFGKLFDVSKHF